MSLFGKTLLGKTAAGAMLFAALAASGCGSDASGDTGSDAKTTPSFEDAMVDYAACIREHGVDMPDPTFSGGGDAGGGKMTFAVPDRVGSAAGDGPTGGPDDSTFKAAAEACQSIMDAVQQSMPKMSAEDEAKIRDEALKFAQCIREHGVDMPDPTFDTAGTSSVIIKGEGDQGPPVDVDKFNQAASECESEGLGGGFRVSSNDGDGGGGGHVGIAGSGASK